MSCGYKYKYKYEKKIKIKNITNIYSCRPLIKTSRQYIRSNLNLLALGYGDYGAIEEK